MVRLHMRREGNQSNQSNRRPPQPHRGYGKHIGTIQAGGREGGMWRKFLTNLCRRRKKTRKRLWQNILKASLGDDWLIAPSPISCHGHRQQVHFIHLYDNIYIVLTGGAQVFCQIHSTTQRRKAPLFQRWASFRATAGRGRDVVSALTVRLSSTSFQL